MTHTLLQNPPLRPVAGRIEIANGFTIFGGFNVNAEAYPDVRILRAAQLRVDNAVVLEISMNNHCAVAMHP